MKTPEENKCGLECIRTNVERICVKPEKGQCPRCKQLVGESLSYIKQLESNYSQVSKALCGKENATVKEILEAVSQVKAELEAVKRERDALFADIKQCNDCYFCRHYGTALSVEPCNSCILEFQHQDFKPGFVWRGVCSENTKEDK